MRRLRVVIVAATLPLLLLASCGDDDDNGDAATNAAEGTTSTTAAPAAEDATVQLSETSLGKVLTDADGMTLYLFTKDTDGKSACSGGCASTWPPLTVDGDPTAGEAVDEDDLGTITRDDGTAQVTYYGHPLYTYGPDEKPGDVNGQNVGGVWFAVQADGTAAGSSSPAPSRY